MMLIAQIFALAYLVGIPLCLPRQRRLESAKRTGGTNYHMDEVVSLSLTKWMIRPGSAALLTGSRTL